ncbi:hypothetical protein SLS53_003253 [Cytospora paraplurivora]|uniref:DUF3074 domain-containing protein n=1 Tax=Cytospora paraplurivora TaxID=2898453 RepID=A0AAN9UCC2_9PEZI
MTENYQPPLLRLAGLRTAQLPPPSATASDLRPFVTALLREAVPFIDTAAPRSGPAGPAANALWRSRGAKAQPGSDAKVEISERTVVVVAAAAAAGEDDTADGGGDDGDDDDDDGDGNGNGNGTGDGDGDGVAEVPTSNSNDIVSDMILGESDQGVLEATVSASATYSRGSDSRRREREERERERRRRRSTAGIVPTARDDGESGKRRKKNNKNRKNRTAADTTNEFWACRRSVHVDEPEKGTASWAEFVGCIRDLHAETEDAFTPNVLAHRTAVAWEGGSGAPGQGQGQGLRDLVVEAGGIAWGGLGLRIVEMKHKVPGPLKPRVFPVLQLVATAVAAAAPVGGAGDGVTGADTATNGTTPGAARDEFIVVSVTISDFAEGPLKSRAGLSAEKGVVVGAYAAVERVRRLAGSGQKIEWLMATASDAKGILPMWVQTRAVPGQIAKDVGLFLGWIARERGKGKGKSREGRGVGGVGDGEGEGEGETAAVVAEG